MPGVRGVYHLGLCKLRDVHTAMKSTSDIVLRTSPHPKAVTLCSPYTEWKTKSGFPVSKSCVKVYFLCQVFLFISVRTDS